MQKIQEKNDHSKTENNIILTTFNRLFNQNNNSTIKTAH